MSNNSGSNTSKMAVPQAKEAMNRFKQEVASEIGVPLKERRPDICPGWLYRRGNGKKDDYETGTADVWRTAVSTQPARRHRTLP